MPGSLRIATRRSRLALAQSCWVQEQVQAAFPDLEVVLCEYVTRGDQVQDRPLAAVGGSGLFTREIEQALLSGEADVAVHSLKDLPSEMTEGLVLGAVPTRASPRDAVVLPHDVKPEYRVPRPEEAELRKDPLRWEGRLAIIPYGGRVGTGSARRRSQVRWLRPDLELLDVRGNVDTRLRKLDAGDYDALILAEAGLRRLGLDHRVTAVLPHSAIVPAAGQGALGVQCRADDRHTRRLLQKINNAFSEICVRAERSLVQRLEGGCSAAIAAYAEIHGPHLYLSAAVGRSDGEGVLFRDARGPCTQPLTVAGRVARKLLRAGAREYLRGE